MHSSSHRSAPRALLGLVGLALSFAPAPGSAQPVDRNHPGNEREHRDAGASPTPSGSASGALAQPGPAPESADEVDVDLQDRKLSRKQVLEAIRKKAGERRDKRVERKQERRERLRAVVKDVLAGRPLTPGMVEGLRTHARRLARLERVRELAAEKERYEVVERVDKLIRAEQERHDSWLMRAKQRATIDPSGVP